MEIEKLYTLSQYVDSINQKGLDANRYIFQYNNFLKQPLAKEMFVNEIEKPKEAKDDELGIVSAIYDQNIGKWQEAEKKVIFDGFVKRVWVGGIAYDNDDLDIFIDISEYKTLHDLAEATNGKLKLKNN